MSFISPVRWRNSAPILIAAFLFTLAVVAIGLSLSVRPARISARSAD